MDRSCRNPDRTSFLRQLSRAAAGWQAQVLRPAVQVGIPRETVEKETGAGRQGSETCNHRDIGPECDHCGGPLPERSATGKLTRCDRQYCSRRCYHAATDPRRKKWLGRCVQCNSPLPQTSRSSRLYCSQKCCDADRTRLEREARALINAAKSCAECGLPMPPEKPLKANYCCVVCAGRAALKRRVAAAEARPCDHCGKAFKPDKPGRRFCCHQCSVEATKRRAAIPCAQCGTVFHPKTYTARFCSLSCIAKAGHASGRLRRFPRKLTAKRLDQLFKRMRPRRPYRMRLTPARLDRLLAKVSRSG